MMLAVEAIAAAFKRVRLVGCEALGSILGRWSFNVAKPGPCISQTI